MITDRKISMLDPLIGTWTVEGRNLSAAPHAADMPVTGIWKVEVMEGGKFLESHWEYDFGSDTHWPECARFSERRPSTQNIQF